MRTEPFQIIRLRLILGFFIAVAIVITIAFVLNKSQVDFIKNSTETSAMINIAGRQRMLCQSISKTALLIVEKRASSDLDNTLDSLITVFDNTHHFLLAQNETLKIDDLSRANIDSLYLLLKVPFKSIIESATAISHADSLDFENLIQQLFHAEASFMPIMDQITYKYDSNSRNTPTINKKVTQTNILFSEKINSQKTFCFNQILSD